MADTKDEHGEIVHLIQAKHASTWRTSDRQSGYNWWSAGGYWDTLCKEFLFDPKMNFVTPYSSNVTCKKCLSMMRKQGISDAWPKQTHH